MNVVNLNLLHESLLNTFIGVHIQRNIHTYKYAQLQLHRVTTGSSLRPRIRN